MLNRIAVVVPAHAARAGATVIEVGHRNVGRARAAGLDGLYRPVTRRADGSAGR